MKIEEHNWQDREEGVEEEQPQEGQESLGGEPFEGELMSFLVHPEREKSETVGSRPNEHFQVVNILHFLAHLLLILHKWLNFHAHF